MRVFVNLHKVMTEKEAVVSPTEVEVDIRVYLNFAQAYGEFMCKYKSGPEMPGLASAISLAGAMMVCDFDTIKKMDNFNTAISARTRETAAKDPMYYVKEASKKHFNNK